MKIMRKTISVLAAAALLAGGSAISAFAEGDYVNVGFDLANNALTLTAKIGAEERAPVVVNVSEYEEGFGGYTDANVPDFSYLIFTGENGAVNETVQFLPEAVHSMRYRVELTGAAGSAENTVLIFKENDAGTQEVLSAFNTKDESGLLAYLSSAEDRRMEKIGFDYDETKPYLEAIAALTAAYRPAGGYSIGALLEHVRYALAMGMIHGGISVDAVMQKYANAFECTYADYSALDSGKKSALDALLAEFDIESADAPVSLNDFLLVVGIRESAAQWGQLREFMLANAKEIGIQTETGSDYMKIASNNRHLVFYIIAEDMKKVTTLKAAAALFDDGVKDVLDDEPEKGGGGSRPSGGNGGGGGGKGSVPVVDIEVDDNPGQVVENKIYSDLEGHFSKDAVEFLSAKHVISGYENGEFRPNSPVSRAEFAKMMVKAFEISAEQTKGFADVSQEDWFAGEVGTLAAYGILEGDGANFYPNASITREDAAVVLDRALRYLGMEFENRAEFEDGAEISGYAAESVAAMAGAGIILGSDNQFRARSLITRGEAAVMVRRAFEQWMGVSK